MANSLIARKRIRKNFGKIAEVAKMPNLIEVQKTSYDQFLQLGIPVSQRSNTGLQEVFTSVFPIRDFSERAELQFVRYELEEPKYDVEECQQRGIGTGQKLGQIEDAKPRKRCSAGHFCSPVLSARSGSAIPAHSAESSCSRIMSQIF